MATWLLEMREDSPAGNPLGREAELIHWACNSRRLSGACSMAATRYLVTLMYEQGKVSNEQKQSQSRLRQNERTSPCSALGWLPFQLLLPRSFPYDGFGAVSESCAV